MLNSVEECIFIGSLGTGSNEVDDTVSSFGTSTILLVIVYPKLLVF